MAQTRRSPRKPPAARRSAPPPDRNASVNDVPSRTVSWLLEENQPAIRYRTLTELLGRPASDPEVLQSRAQIPTTGWAAEILARRTPGSGWSDAGSPYRPKYVSTNWMMLVLSDLGLNRSDPAVRDACEYWLDEMPASNGGVGGNSKGNQHYCVAANMARALMRLGYTDDPRIRRTLEWLVETADPKGGWSCFGLSRNLDSWEALSAFAAYPRAKWTASMRECVARGAEFFLERELHRQGSRYAPWYRTHYPVHYYYDLLVGLDFMTQLGYGADPRMEYAFRWLESRRRRDGAWNLDAVHPDVGPTMRRWFSRHPSQQPIPFALETVGRPSKMVTLAALKALAAADRAAGPVGAAP